MRKTEKAARGQTIQCDYGRDDSSHKLSNTTGYPMGGSKENLSHSLGGASARQDGTGKDKKDRFS